MDDPLAKFRGKLTGAPVTASSAPAKPNEPDEYVAFATKDKTTRLRIRRALAPTRSPGYGYLLDVVYDGSFGTNFVPVYTYLMVLVRGKNLQALVFALENGMADFIQEFDPDRWAKPTDEKAAFIESIKVVVQESASSMSGTEQTRH
jgi:hypothetical protein